MPAQPNSPAAKRPEAPPRPKRGWGLFRRRSVWVPTFRGCLLFLVLLVALVFVAVRSIHPFLALNSPLPGGVLVVEGWAPNYALRAAVDEFQTNRYSKLLVTGGPIEWGSPVSEYKTYAELGASTLVKFGLSTNVVQAVPAPSAQKDRTYVAAATLAKWFGEHQSYPTSVNLLTIGPHSRRSRLLYRKALGKGVKVGVTSIPIRDYDSKHWWRSSAGFRIVTGETLAYGYSRFIFRAPD